MKRIRSKSYRKNFFKGKGFYIALICCLIGSGAMAFAAVNQTLGDIKSADEISSQTSESQGSAYVANSEEDSSSSRVEPSEESSSSSHPVGNMITDQVVVPVEANSDAPIFVYPVSGDIILSFSNSELVKSITMGDWRTHDGIDIKANLGDGVKAAAEGTVSDIYIDPLWGQCIEIEHSGGYVSYYFGLSDVINVSLGQVVDNTTVIGAVGDTAEIEILQDIHLHFAVKQDDQWVDPENLF